MLVHTGILLKSSSNQSSSSFGCGTFFSLQVACLEGVGLPGCRRNSVCVRRPGFAGVGLLLFNWVTLFPLQMVVLDLEDAPAIGRGPVRGKRSRRLDEISAPQVMQTRSHQPPRRSKAARLRTISASPDWPSCSNTLSSSRSTASFSQSVD